MRKTTTIVGSLILLIIAVLGGYYIFHNVTSIVPPVATITSTTTTPGTTSTTTTTTSTTSVKPVGGLYTYGNVTLPLGGVAKYSVGTLTIKALLEDSRCPLKAQCIQAGTVRVDAMWADAKNNPIVLQLGKKVVVDNIQFTLTTVTPVPTMNATIQSDTYRFTVLVEKPTVVSTKPCYVGGCSSEVCSDKTGVVTSCLYKAENACYQGATCERQTSGSCGWTQTPSLKQCLLGQGTL